MAQHQLQHHFQIIPEIAADDHISVPGDTKNLTAKVTVNDAPKAGFLVKFSIDGYKAVGQATTGADGKASLSFTVPDDFVAKVWTLRARTDATVVYAASEDTGKLHVIKGATAVVLGDLMWGLYEPNEPPLTNYGAYSVKVVQNYGVKKTIVVPIRLTVNGVLYNIVQGDANIVPLPMDATTWTVDAEFQGNGSYTGSEATRTYKKP